MSNQVYANFESWMVKSGNGMLMICVNTTASVNHILYHCQQVNRHSVCYWSSTDHSSNSKIPLTDKLDVQMKDNLEKNPTIKWQYYLSAEGIAIEYPAQNKQCEERTFLYNRYSIMVVYFSVNIYLNI